MAKLYISEIVKLYGVSVWVNILIFQMSYDIMIPYGFLIGFRETETHARAHSGCHMSAFGSGCDRLYSKALDDMRYDLGLANTR
ncbi:hypothetical protein CRYUN_Cryun09bG0123700 [Craigia yunnanensis]